jgi:hypothetical protein
MVRLRYTSGGVPAAVTLFLALGVPCFAQNEGFENGDFSFWQTIGTATVITTYAGFNPTEGNLMAKLDAGTAEQFQVEGFLGIPFDSSRTISSGFNNGFVAGGSALKRVVDVFAGETLAFDFNFLGLQEALPFNDFAFFSVVPGLAMPGGQKQPGGTNGPILLTDVAHTGNQSASGWMTQTFTFTEAGTYTLGIGVFNQGDNASSANSNLLVDNLRPISAPGVVPEPGAVATGAVMSAVLALGVVRGRRKKTL